MRIAVAWFRRDLRVHDNPALAAARGADRVACLFVVEPSMLAVSEHRAAVLARAVDSFREELAARRATLTLRFGPAAQAVPAFAAEVRADVVFAAADVTPLSRARDEAVAAALADGGIAFETVPGLFVHEPDAIRSPSGKPYKIFTPYHRRWLTVPPRPREATPRSLRSIDAASDPQATEHLAAAGGEEAHPAGERAARASARRFFRRGGYEEARHRLDGRGGSRLSPAFRFGSLSPLVASGDGPDAWVRQLAWRDFAAATAVEHPRLFAASLRAPKRRWSRDAGALAAWRSGETGEPVVDAAMRQLRTEGWISNRARMTVASFLCRDLRIDWREGAAHFMRFLVDGDPSVNAFNWQWVAGTGFDAPAPFWRLNPARQGERYDADGSWRARWAARVAG